MYFYTFCVDINKHSRSNLSKIFNILLQSIYKNIKEYKLICFTNFKKELINTMSNKYDVESNKYNVEYRDYYDNQKNKLYSNEWLNLSFNKINIYKDLYDEFKLDFIWVDLDTIICYDISYINKLSNVFIENGGDIIKQNILFLNNNDITVPRNRYIQGNFWKLNIHLYNKLMSVLNKIKINNLTLRYDLQDLFSYYIYIEKKGDLNDINILGNNVEKHTINGLAVWSRLGNTHANIDGLNNLYIENNKLKSKFHTEKDIHLLSFTFYTLLELHNYEKFKNLLFFVGVVEEQKKNVELAEKQKQIQKPNKIFYNRETSIRKLQFF